MNINLNSRQSKLNNKNNTTHFDELTKWPEVYPPLPYIPVLCQFVIFKQCITYIYIYIYICVCVCVCLPDDALNIQRGIGKHSQMDMINTWTSILYIEMKAKTSTSTNLAHNSQHWFATFWLNHYKRTHVQFICQKKERKKCL